jgi:hypothetical protein
MAQLDEAREPLRDLDAGESLLAAVGVADEEDEAERERRDVRERLPGPDGERGQDGIELTLEARRQLRQLLLRALGDRADDDLLTRQGGLQLTQPRARLRGLELEHASPDLAKDCARKPPVRRPDRHARRDLVHETRDANLEEIVELLRGQRAEADPLEQRHRRIGRQREDARGEVQ